MQPLIANKAPDAYKLPGNPLYEAFNGLFLQVWKEPHTSESIYRSCYVTVPCTPDIDLPFDIKELPPRVKEALGAYEVDLLSYLFGHDNCVLLLTGGVGCGKTSILRTLRYILRDLKDMIGNVLDIHYDLNARKAEIESIIAKNGEKAAHEYIYSLIRRSILAKAGDFLGKLWPEFYKHAWAHVEFLKEHAGALAAIQNIFGVDSDEEKNFRATKQQEFTQSREYLGAVTGYLLDKHNIKTLVLLDNADPLPRSTCEALLWVADELVKLRNCKVVLPIRPNTRRALRGGAIDALVVDVIEVLPPPLAEIAKKRAHAFESQFKARLQEPRIRRQLEDRGLTLDRLPDALQRMMTTILSTSVVDEIDNITNHNRRVAMATLPIYFSAPTVIKDLASTAGNIEHEIEEDIPVHVYLKSIITFNRRTYFAPPPDIPSVRNIWYMEHSSPPLCYFLQLMVLSALQRSGGETTVAQISSRCEDSLSDVFPQRKIGEDVRLTLRSLVDSMLIDTPEFMVSQRSQPLHGEARISLSHTGSYYLSSFAYRFEYFSYIKDAIPVDDKVRRGIISSLDRPNLGGRFGESGRMIVHLLDREQELLEALKKNRTAMHNYVNMLALRIQDQPVPFCSRFVSAFQAIALEHRLKLSPAAINSLEDIERAVTSLTLLVQN